MKKDIYERFLREDYFKDKRISFNKYKSCSTSKERLFPFFHELRSDKTHPNGIEKALRNPAIDRALQFVSPMSVCCFGSLSKLIEKSFSALLRRNGKNILLVKGHRGANLRRIEWENIYFGCILIAESPRQRINKCLGSWIDIMKGHRNLTYFRIIVPAKDATLTIADLTDLLSALFTNLWMNIRFIILAAKQFTLISRPICYSERLW